MALFKISKGLSDNLPSTYNEGYCYLTTDDQKFYIDTTNKAEGRIILNANLADSLRTARTINLTGNEITGSVAFDGSQNVNLNATIGGRVWVGEEEPTSDEYVLWIPPLLSDPGTTTTLVTSVNGMSGDVTINTGVLTINDVLPDDDGNIDLSVEGRVWTGNSEPPSEEYTLWIDTDEPESLAMRADAIKYKSFSVGTADWVGSGPYTYTLTANGITANCAVVNLTLDAASQTYQKSSLDWETTANAIVLSTATKPTGTINGYLIAMEVTVI